MEDGNVVATAVYSFDNGNMARNAFLFYKAKVDAGESKNYYVEIESDASVNSFEIKALDFSWGYRFLARADYNNAWGPVTISPRLAWAHDVSGTTPGPGGSFIDGRTQVTVGLGFNYLQEWIFDFSYTSYMGGGKYNQLHDRDFFAASVRYSF